MSDSKSTEELREQAQSYSPEVRQLAYAMETMSHVEKCAALYDLAERQHAIGMKNGRFGYVSKHDFDQELAKRVEEARMSAHKIYDRELKYQKNLVEMLMNERDLKADPRVIVVTEEQLATLNNQPKEAR